MMRCAKAKRKANAERIAQTKQRAEEERMARELENRAYQVCSRVFQNLHAKRQYYDAIYAFQVWALLQRIRQ